MAAHREAPHFPWIRIREVAGEKWLVHDGTRERKQVGRNVHLMQADSGKAYIVDEGAATVFASTTSCVTLCMNFRVLTV